MIDLQSVVVSLIEIQSTSSLKKQVDKNMNNRRFNKKD